MINWHVTESEEEEGEEEEEVRPGQGVSSEIDIFNLLQLWAQRGLAVIKEMTNDYVLYRL